MSGARTSAQAAPDLVPRLLFLPHTDDGWADDWRAGTREVPVPDGPAGHPRLGPAPEDPGRLFWFRWIAGHQLSFLAWRSMSDLVRSVGPDLPDPGCAADLARCVDAYSAMLVYASTVPRTRYHSDIRARMALQHPAFSGTWAPDYRPVARLLRGRSPWLTDPSTAALAAAVERNRAVHDHIADHLVPDGRSLLRRSAGSAGAAVSREKEDLFDNFFMTIRRPTSQVDGLAQLADRIGDVGLDLAHHGLYPRVGGRHHPVLGVDADPAMVRLVADVPAVLRRVPGPAGRTLQGVR